MSDCGASPGSHSRSRPLESRWHRKVGEYSSAAEIIRAAADLNLVGGDVVEVAPEYDSTTNTAQAGASTLFAVLAMSLTGTRSG